MTNSRNGARSASLGDQEPRVSWIPDYTSSAGDEAIDLAADAGLHLDPWEQYVLRHSLGERPDGKWAAFEVGVEVSRQNGKGAILEARELAGLFLLDERLLIHSAHEFATSLEAFRRLRFLIEDNADLSRRVKRISQAHGEEGIELMNRQRIRFRTRTKGGGRGFSGDWLCLDEAMVIPEAMHGALLPTLSARPNPQVWYTGSAVDQEVHEHGVVFARVRDRGIKGGDQSLMYVEWSVEADHPEDITPKQARDPELWAQANPGLGIRITAEHVAREQRSMAPRTFAVERLGVGDWPAVDGDVGDGIDPEVWALGEDIDSEAEDPLHFTVDVRPDRSSTSIGVGGRRADGYLHVEVVERRKGTGWVVERLVELVERHDAKGVLLDGASPAAALIPKLEDAGIRVETLGAKEYGQACGRFFDAVDNRDVRHLGQPELDNAIRGAVKRPLGDAWAWSRKSSTVDISPLVACTLALWKVETTAPRRTRRMVSA